METQVQNPAPSRMKYIIIAVVVLLVVVALAVGLGVGLSQDESCTKASGRSCTSHCKKSSSTGGTKEEIRTRVKKYIDDGTCNCPYATEECEDTAAASHYDEFTYNGKRVIIFNRIPSHEAEQDMPSSNPNKRCTSWNFVQLPLTLQIDSNTTYVDTSLGSVGVAYTGAVFFNWAADPDLNLALLAEGHTMDSCSGHSAVGGEYHYHRNIYCSKNNIPSKSTPSVDDALNATACVQIGWHFDGVPVYGYCSHGGTPMKSCYTLNAGAETDQVTTFYSTITTGKKVSDYTWSANGQAGCNLDKASGMIHPGTNKYSYFMTEDFPWMPSYYRATGNSRCDAN